MVEAGDIVDADLQVETRRLVLVLSNAQFHQETGRSLVAPQTVDANYEVPWRVRAEGMTFAVDAARTLPVEQLLNHRGRAPYSAVSRAHRALRAAM